MAADSLPDEDSEARKGDEEPQGRDFGDFASVDAEQPRQGKGFEPVSLTDEGPGASEPQQD